MSVFEITILSNLGLYSVVKLYTISMDVPTQALLLIDNVFIAAVVTQFIGFILCRIFSSSKRILLHSLLMECCPKRGQAAVDHEEDWEVYEDLRRHMLDNRDTEDRESERLPINAIVAYPHMVYSS